MSTLQADTCRWALEGQRENCLLNSSFVQSHFYFVLEKKVHNIFVLPFVLYYSELVTLPEEIIFSYIVYYIHTPLSLHQDINNKNTPSVLVLLTFLLPSLHHGDHPS
jgi:hypothetical protein